MLEETLEKYFGFKTFRKGQKEVIQKIINNESAAAIFPTGSGKSLCYQLPAMMMPAMTLVVSPLLALMKDQLDFLLEKNIPAARLDSTLEIAQYNAIIEKAKNGELKILMISVERFKNERFRFHLQKMNISLMVIDEAHCVSEWGHNFRPEYLKLPLYQQEFGIKQVLLLTATATSRVVEDMCRNFNIRKENVVITGFYRENLFLRVSPTPESEKNNRLLLRIGEAPGEPTIVYVTLQKTAERVAAFLYQQGINAHPYHAGMKNDEREDIQSRFMAGELTCIVATIAFGMGIDKKDIRRIIHYDMPKSIEHYAQEIGRSGRDGKPSLCEVLANRDNLNVLENFVYGDTPDLESIVKLLSGIKDNPDFHWEIRFTALSAETNIRMLPLKTLLVYLEMNGIIRPRYSYFADYSFKYILQPDKIIERFQDERKQFVTSILTHCHTKQVWTQVHMLDILNSYKTDRNRVIVALDYFNEKGWIKLQARMTTEVYDILNQAFDVEALARKIFNLFKNRETHEINRIHHMVGFFENNTCLSFELARYFGEEIESDKCGHCSVCQKGPAIVRNQGDMPPLSTCDFNKLSTAFSATAGEHMSVDNLTRFFCGIYTPVFARMKIKSLPYFGKLEKYPLPDVREWVGSHLKG